MKLRVATLLFVAVGIAIAIGAWLGGWGGDLSGGRAPPALEVTPPPAVSTPPLQPSLPPPAAPLPSVAPPKSPAVVVPPAPSSAARFAAPGTPPPVPEAIAHDKTKNEIDSISLMFRDFRTLMGDNPVGSNAEIIKSLNGGNPKGARLGPAAERLNGEGEFIDEWGTPYFFHQMSATHMEITSAGPDKRLGTPDDIKGR